jgi:glycosyltransferase involved in cell wall biosynthesis
VCLNASLVDNMPNSLLEAMASGVPIVSTRVGGVPFIVEHERSALLVPPGDDGAMAAAILRLLREPALADRLRSTARAAVDAYTWEAVGPQWLHAYRDATGPRP